MRHLANGISAINVVTAVANKAIAVVAIVVFRPRTPLFRAYRDFYRAERRGGGGGAGGGIHHVLTVL
jgi:hypothetical protein